VTIADRLAEHVAHLRFDDIPESIVALVKDSLVVHLAAGFRGQSSQPARTALGLALSLGGDAGPAVALGEVRRLSILDAVFVTSAKMHATNLDDFHEPSGVHPAVVVLPSALVVGSLAHVTGAELIASIVVGYDISCTLGSAAFTWEAAAPRRPTAVFGPFAAAATSARLLAFDRTTCARAMGLAAHAGMGLVEGGHELWHLWPQIARNGVTAAYLARAGAQVSPTSIEGANGLYRSFFGAVPDGLDLKLAALGREFEISRTTTKRYASSGLNIVPIELLLALVREHRFAAADVAHLTIVLPEHRRQRDEVQEREFATRGTPGSVRFLLALILLDGRYDDESREARTRDARVLDTMSRIEIAFEPDHPTTYARLEVLLHDGNRHASASDDWRFPPLNRREVLRRSGARVITHEQIELLADSIESLEDVADVTRMVECLAPAT
jgi:2-methylcitrate dehydratase PrpD